MSKLVRIVFMTIFLAFLVVDSKAQQNRITIPQILNDYESGRVNADNTYLRMSAMYSDEHIDKCATPLHMFAHKYKDEISPSLLNNKPAFRNKSMMATFTSASGKFLFTYETAGQDAVPSTDGNSNGVPDYVEWAAIAADSSYKLLVETQGYTDPIPDGTTYDISFEELQGTYGFAQTQDGNGPGTRIVVENDFEGFPDNDDPDGAQRGALRATVAHEFKHAIQFAQNGYSGDSDSWAEMDATLIEEVVYDQVNDYYNYLGGSGDVFGNPGVTVIPGSYEDATWALFFHEKYGSDFWVDTWARIETSNSTLGLLDAVDLELTSRGEDYTNSLLELYAWHFASGAYNNQNFGFQESMFYPSPNPQLTLTQIDDQFSDTIALGRFASYFVNVLPPASQSGNASFLIDTDSAEISMAAVAIFDDGTVSFKNAVLESGLLVVDEGWKWEDIAQVGVIILNENRSTDNTFKVRVSDSFSTSIIGDGSTPQETSLKQNYPNPFNPSTTIPVSISEFQKVKVDIYDITGRLVQSVFNGNLPSGNYALPVNLERYASGVYLYRLQTDDHVQIKRMTLVK
ncbi:MAG: T9SS type A sorting domain-containing protein [Balneola sp.]